MIEYSNETIIKIDWSDLDLLGHVNNLSILRYMQTARVKYFEKIGFSVINKELKIGPVMASVHGQFKKQLFYPGDVRVLTLTEEMKTTSIHMKHYVINDGNEIIAEGHDVVVMYDFIKNTKHIISEDVRKKIEEIEKERRTF